MNNCLEMKAQYTIISPRELGNNKNGNCPQYAWLTSNNGILLHNFNKHLAPNKLILIDRSNRSLNRTLAAVWKTIDTFSHNSRWSMSDMPNSIVATSPAIGRTLCKAFGFSARILSKSYKWNFIKRRPRESSEKSEESADRDPRGLHSKQFPRFLWISRAVSIAAHLPVHSANHLISPLYFDSPWIELARKYFSNPGTSAGAFPSAPQHCLKITQKIKIKIRRKIPHFDSKSNDRPHCETESIQTHQ